MTTSRQKIRKLTISGFRGFRFETTLNMSSNTNSVLLYGPNAKGKSCIADAVEWFFTGTIKELSKEGCTRSDYRHRLLPDDDNAIVSFEFSDKSLNSALLLPSASAPSYSNTTPEFAKHLSNSANDLLILRHRDLRTFVEASKSYKRREITKLIGMENWEDIRDQIAQTVNRLETETNELVAAKQSREAEAARHASLEAFDLPQIWAYLTGLVQKLGIKTEVKSIGELTSAENDAKALLSESTRSSELSAIASAESLLSSLNNLSWGIQESDSYIAAFNEICAKEEIVLWMILSSLLKEGKKVLQNPLWDSDLCPLCRMEISSDNLIAHINEHLAHGKDFQKKIKDFENTTRTAKQSVSEAISQAGKIEEIELVEIEGLDLVKSAISEMIVAILEVQGSFNLPVEIGASLSFEHLYLPMKKAAVSESINKLQVNLNKRKNELEPSAEEQERIEAFQTIGNLKSDLEALQRIENELGPIKGQATTVKLISNAFQELRRSTIGKVLDRISADVSRFFLVLHPGEGFDDIQLKFLPEADGVEFHIYFKGEEITPPRKFLSESYLGGLGVCLFLATVNAFNRSNDFVVLDDIVNSLDSEHRCDLARLLVKEFSDHQLIVLTHDTVWFEVFRRMATSGWNHYEIRSWGYEEGIVIDSSPSDEVEACRQSIASGVLMHCAPRVRSYVEHRLKKICQQTGVRVRFRTGRQNDVRMTGELLSELRSYLTERNFLTEEMKVVFDELIASSFLVNYGSHDQPPDPSSLSVGDVEFAFNRIQDLEAVFICGDCGSKLWNMTTQDFRLSCKCGNFRLQ
ncbi:MAG: AAA family ATPase [Anaerolineales bacterium]|nr:AAA family ATPase [Anaerolineales bacterium]